VPDVNKERASAVSEVVSGFPVTTIVAFVKGFACAAGAGLVHLYEKSDEDYYKKIREIQVTSISPTLRDMLLRNKRHKYLGFVVFLLFGCNIKEIIQYCD